MSLIGVILGTVLQLGFALFSFMAVIFSSASMSNRQTFGNFEKFLLDSSMYTLPTVCILNAILVIYFYKTGSSLATYWWYGLPVVLLASYLVFALSLAQRPPL
jgi:hypothetical protein